MKLIDRYLPDHHFAEEHSRFIPAPPACVLDVVDRPDVVDDPIARSLIALREAPNRLAGRLGFASNLQHRPSFGFANFTFLGRDGDRELAYCLAGRFWQSDYGLVAVADATAFSALNPSGIAKLVMNFTVEAEGAGTRLTTRTRVCCGDDATKRSFTPYWLLIRPASGLIRRRLLKRAHDAAIRSLMMTPS
ncbi:hypothetical protein AVHY2522_18260 [Acidovorax sp. SUPP2522]|uniref:hypothetical protein n=1 Tax=unclassified Acidovorax TaxID=2684926 RepID=UPI00234A75FD|nr:MULTISPECIES: hypothetical protein [unclassified Acidovorax]WCM99606.1 hypothetical protein M5C96_09475 [Acidovorax sp. GBBC 1281]GKT18295.1 hypothetical protein AVHY2522_18260 [Acidovorax sp. SUPP2522]